VTLIDFGYLYRPVGLLLPKTFLALQYFRDRNWEVQAGSPDKIFDKKYLYV
jgi:hypothetical protein